MKDTVRRFTLRMEDHLLQKLGYIAEYEGRTKNKEIQQLVKRRVERFETEHGCIVVTDEEEEEDA